MSIKKDGIDVDSVADFLNEKYQIPEKEFIEFLEKYKQDIPVSIFNDKQTPFESVTKYLHENLSLSYAEIGRKLNRDPRVIRRTYLRGKEKLSGKLKVDKKYTIPIEVFSKYDFSISEVVVFYLKNHYDLTYHKIATLLKRDDRTIWTIYDRARKKNEK